MQIKTLSLGLQGAMGLAATGLALLGAIWPGWIELAFDVDPDGGNGSFEWAAAAAAFVLVALLFFTMPDWNAPDSDQQRDSGEGGVT